MNPSPKNEAEAIRSGINVTRQRMDDTMDALGERLEPRHLLDEILGFFRRSSHDGESRLAHMRETLTDSCNTAVHTVTDTVRKNPVPALLVGAGLAWLIYESRRDKRVDRYAGDLSPADYGDQERRYDPDMHFDRPLDYPSTLETETNRSDQGGSKLEHLKEQLSDNASAATSQVKETLSHAGEATREKVGELRERAGEIASRAKERTQQAYTRTRDRVVTTADQHPIETGLVALAAGLIAGLVLPTPNAVNRRVGPAADRLRDRSREVGREILEKGKRVAQAAVHAAKDEAEVQGLTPEQLREKAIGGSRANETRSGPREQGQPPSVEGNQSGSQQNDPSVARPVM
jgi:ElaB/YqjD/DUF883 family membrane-anchored ribosome-binding protein